MQNDIFSNKTAFFSKEVYYKLSLCENFHKQHCKALTGLFNCVQMIGGGHHLLPEIFG